MSQGWPSVAVTRLALILCVPVALVLGGRVVAWAATSVKTWAAGDTLTATDLNANFNALNTAMVDLSSDQTIAGTKTFSAPIDIGLQNLTFNIAGTLPPECTAGTVYVDCKCPAGLTAIGGGGYAGANMFLDESRNPSGDSACATGAADSCWRVGCANNQGVRGRCTFANVICARIKP